MLQRELAILLSAAAVVLSARPARAQDMWERRVVVDAGAPDPRVVHRDLRYGGSDADRLMDVYAPDSREQLAPFVIFVHGSPLPPDLPVAVKDIGQFASYARLLAAQGIGVVTFSHRFRSVGELRVAEADIGEAVDYVRRHAAEWGLDSSQECVWLVSAGGVFASNFLEGSGLEVKCLIMYYPLLDADVYPELGLVPYSRF